MAYRSFSVAAAAAAIFFEILSVSAVSGGPSEAATKVPALYVFGDSLVDVGNNNHLKLSTRKANFPPNGIDYPKQEATGRFSNGLNTADFIAERIGVATPPPYLSLKPNSSNDFISGVNFASGGAGVFDERTRSENLRQMLSLSKQVEYYSTVYEGIMKGMGSLVEAENHLSKSLFAIVIGGNDILGYLDSSNSSNNDTSKQHVASMLHSLETQLRQLYKLGGRKFLVAGIGMVGCCPQQRHKINTGGCNEDANRWAVQYNEGLKPMLQKLASGLKGFTYSYLDTYVIMQNAIKNPNTYGFTEVEGACCGLGRLRAKIPCVPIARHCTNRSDHLFWDLYHPTEAAARVFVNTVLNPKQNYAFPLNIDQLIAP